MAKPPCIVFLFDWRPILWSTREEYFRHLAERLVARGITPVLIASEVNDPEVRRRFETAGARVETCSYHAGLVQYWRHIRRLRREFTIQLAHIRFFDYFSAVPWVCRLAGVRNILFTEANSGEWQGTGWRRALVQWRTGLMCYPLTHVIAISKFIQRRLQDVGLRKDRITVVYNGVDIASFKPDLEARASVRQQMDATSNTVVMIFAAVLVDWKRPEIALEVCGELKRRGCDVQLWMAGIGGLRQQLDQQVARLGISSQVKWLGHQKDLQRWLAAADLFLHTTVGEAFGNVFVEAMGCGLPVVASRSGSSPELVVEDTAAAMGKLIEVSAGEVNRLADAVMDLTRDPQRYAQYSQAALQQSKRFSTAASVAGTLAVYDSLLN